MAPNRKHFSQIALSLEGLDDVFAQQQVVATTTGTTKQAAAIASPTTSNQDELVSYWDWPTTTTVQVIELDTQEEKRETLKSNVDLFSASRLEANLLHDAKKRTSTGVDVVESSRLDDVSDCYWADRIQEYLIDGNSTVHQQQHHQEEYSALYWAEGAHHVDDVDDYWHVAAVHSQPRAKAVFRAAATSTSVAQSDVYWREGSAQSQPSESDLYWYQTDDAQHNDSDSYWQETCHDVSALSSREAHWHWPATTA